MNPGNPTVRYDFSAKTIAITGGGGVLCGAMAKALAACHANVVILDRDLALAEKTVAGLNGLVGATLWLLSPASAFVTGIVVPIDGGFSAYTGV
jgi:NAD(P)-dependent dehydrogenase (short-subunit alcohol dehydrogenase family)